MELKCVLVFTLGSLLSVTATPHGYGVKGGAVARAESGAAAGAFGAVGLPLSIQSGPGFSGSFSKSSSTSFASSSASSSASSFSFSGSGASGFGLNSLGTTGTGGCTGECQSGSKGINDSNGTGSTGHGSQTFGRVNSNAAAVASAGASAGSYNNFKDGTQSPCSNGVCPNQKSQCEGPSCKDVSEVCTSGQCGSKSSSKMSLPDRDNDCVNGHCKTNSNSASEGSPVCENGDCSKNNKKASYNNADCALGQCNQQPTTGNFGTNVKCISGKCASGSSATPDKNDGSYDIPVSIASSSTSSHDFNHVADISQSRTTTSQEPGVDCENGNCDSLLPNTKPSYEYSNTNNQNHPQIAVPSSVIAPTKPATHLTVPKEGVPCSHPNCKSPSTQLQEPNLASGNLNCAGGYCNNEKSDKYPLSKNEHSNKYDSQQIRPSYSSGSPAQNGNNVNPSCSSGNCDNPSNSNPLLPKITGTTDNCQSGNCGSRPSYESSHDIQVSRVPSHTQAQGFNYSPNCPSGHCESLPNQPIAVGSIQPTIPSKPTPNENCPFGNCGYPSYSSPSQPKIPNYSHVQMPSRPNNCLSGNCGTYPSYQNNLDIQVSKVPTQSQVTDYSPKPSYHPFGDNGSKNPIPSKEPFSNGPSNCALGNCQPGDFKITNPLVPSYSQGSTASGPSFCQSGTCGSYPSSHDLNSPYPRLPSYPQNILPNKPLDCASGNCANYPTAAAHPIASSVGSDLPNSSELPLVSSSPTCTSGNCGNNPTYQQGSFSSSGNQSPSYSATIPATNCASGNCAINPSTSGASGPKTVAQSNGYAPSTYTSSTGLISSGSSTGPLGSSGNCPSGKCSIYPNTQPTSHQTKPTASNSPDKLPDYIALGVAGSASNTGSFKPSSISSSQHSGSASHTTLNSGIAAGIHSQSSIFSHDKEQEYTGGFGGPPGILKPYEFSAPSHHLALSNKKDQGNSQCSTGKCGPQSESDISNKKHDLSSSTGPCTSAKCETQSGKTHYGLSNTASGAFAAAAASSEGVLYTGGFGGPPGILKPYDGGKIAGLPGGKHPTGSPLGSNNDAYDLSGNKLNGSYGALAGSAATANAGVFGTGSYGGHNKAGGCESGCGSSGHESYGASFGLAGGLSKNGLLEKLHNGVNAAGAAAQSAASAISGAGASSFGVGGGFASSSASAHSNAGSTKGGYGR